MKRLFSIVISFMIAIAVVVPAAANESHAAFNPRTSIPSYGSSAGKAYYYTNDNIFYRSGYGPNQVKRSDGKYCIGNCTWYAYGRASEILGKPLNSNFRWSASEWWSINKKGKYYPYGSTPKVGAIACYGTHVAIVEKVIDGKPYVSESGWTLSWKKPTSASDLVFHYGSPWVRTPKGYIYITDAGDTSAPDIKNVNYSVKITADDLNMRTGPGTEYQRIGYAKAGTYKVSQECGNWAKLEDSGHWICLDYVTKVQTPQPPAADSGESVNYKVKISAVDLNMRTGPGKSYEAKGYVKPGTYTVVKKNNGWGKLKETGYWVSLKYTHKVADKPSAPPQVPDNAPPASSENVYKVKINTLALRMRTGPGTQYSIKGVVMKGSVYTIKNTKNGWGQLSKNGYWIKLSYTIPVNAEYNVEVKAKDLNMRTGPGILYKAKGYIKPGVYTIVKTDDGWGKLKKNGYWIKLSYTTKL